MEELDDIAQRTLAHYERNAQQFFAGTIGHDVSQNIAALLGAIQADPPFTILDLGCGPGRDLKTFASMGHRAIGVDGAQRFVEMARDYSGCEVWRQDLLHLDLPPEMFDGIFANAVLFHVPSQALPQVLERLFAALKPGGVLFSSNPRGNNEEGWNGERYGSYYDYATWEGFVTGAGFIPLHHYYRPEGLPREQQPWLASVWRKPDARWNVRVRTEELERKGYSGLIASPPGHAPFKELTMNKDQVNGALKDIGGKIQEEAGKLTGSKEQQAKGLANQVEGKTQEKVGDAKEVIKDALN